MRQTFDMADPDQLFQIALISRRLIEAHDQMQWHEKTYTKEFGERVEQLREALGMKRQRR